MSIFTPFDLETLRTPIIPGLDTLRQGSGGYYGADHQFQNDANAGIWGEKDPSNRDNQSFPDANGNATRPLLIDMSNYMPGDINTHELLFTINKGDTIIGIGELKQSERVMGLARLNEWLRISTEGLQFGKQKSGRSLRDSIALRGILITSMEQNVLQQGYTKAVTIVYAGRATMPDITSYLRSNLAYRNRDETQTFDYISICFRRIVPTNPLKIDEALDFQPYWQACPQRHPFKTPPKSLYSSINYLIEQKHHYQGFYIHVGHVRTVINGHDHKKIGVNEKCYDYCFGKDGRNMSHVSKYNELPQVELFMTLAT
jgi:hypothetical protein